MIFVDVLLLFLIFLGVFLGLGGQEACAASWAYLCVIGLT